MTGALKGIRVLDFTHVLAGPYATRILGDLGADVVKVVSEKRPGNTPDSTYYRMWNRNKRSLSLDMSTEHGREIARALAERADIVIENFSPGVLDRWGIGYDVVSKGNTGVIYIQMSGMGDGGPWGDFVSFAATVHALAGLTYLTGVPGREDIGIGNSFNDHQAGLHAVTIMLAAIEYRRTTGKGQRVDLAQYEVGVALTGTALLDYFANGNVQKPVGNRHQHEIVAPHDTYPCLGNDRWVAITVMTEVQWQNFCTAIGRSEWTGDPRFATALARVEHLEELNNRIADWTMKLDAYDVQELLQNAGVPAGVVQTGKDLLQRDPQLSHSGFFRKTIDAGAYNEATPFERIPLQFSRTPVEEYRAPRAVGADNAEILSEWLEMAEQDIQLEEQIGTLR